MSNYVLSIDQSLSKCAYVLWKDGEIERKGIIRTGNTRTKTRTKNVPYFDTVDEQIDHICDELYRVIQCEFKKFRSLRDLKSFKVIFEGLSFGSVGDATRNLAGLYFRLRNEMSAYCSYSEMVVTAPTSLKAFARDFLPEDEQIEVSGRTGKIVKRKMDKKLMVKACEEVAGKDFLKGLNMSTGKDDLADAYFLGKLYLSKEGL